MKALLLLCLLLPGCALAPFGQPDYAALTAAQSKAAMGDKNAGVICSRFPTPYGYVETTIVTFDQKSIQDGSVKGSSQNGGCIAEVNSVAHDKPAAAPKGAP